MIFIAIFLAVVGTIGTIVCLFRPKNPSNLKVISYFLWHGLTILGIRIEVRNEDRFKLFPAVLVSNHQENMDVFVGARVIPDKTVSLGKRSILYIPFFGLFYWLSGNILINRSNKKSAFNTMDEAAKEIIERKISVWVLAEGTRSKGRGILPFKKGAFITAIKAQVPIYPIAISTYKNHITFSKWNAGKIIVDVMAPIDTTQFNMETVNDLRDLCHSQVKNKVAELDLELDQV
jgi:1-acyl-sn-glycerol-3-phosphate acyltransferase